ncbi:MAG TPA: TadE/TadG family type IV pilus assembly protein [Mycobacteriales bacterium]|nr:TadE/TadG family type IV pilus assembly protein [Mycobacteriales bacterium]
MRRHSDDGAAAVEFALVMPILFLVVFAIVDFGRAYFATSTLSHAAREGVRVVALGGTAGAAERRTVEVACSVDAGQPCPASHMSGLETTTAIVLDAAGTTMADTATCTFGEATTVVATVSFDYLTPLGALMSAMGGSSSVADGQVESRASMRCGG